MSRRSAPSPIKSFVDLACGAFGAVMLLAVVLVQASPRGNQTDEASGMVEVRFWAGYHPEILKKNVNVRLEVDQKLIHESILGGWKTQATETSVSPGYEVEMDAAEDSTIRITAKAGRLTKPLEILITLSDNDSSSRREKRGVLTPLLMSPTQPEIAVLGDVWHPDLVKHLKDSSFAPITAGQNPENGPLTFRILFDPENRDPQKGLKLELLKQ